MGEKSKIHVVTHVFQGILQDIRAFRDETAANIYEAKLCKDNNLPVDRQKRHMTDTEDDIQQWEVELE
jgi:hypothetical protein